MIVMGEKWGYKCTMDLNLNSSSPPHQALKWAIASKTKRRMLAVQNETRKGLHAIAQIV
jgi:hypothetical protein